MLRLFTCLLPSTFGVTATTTRNLTSFSALSGKRLSKHKTKGKVQPRRKSTHSTIYQSGAELRVPSAQLIRAWKSDQREDTGHTLKDAYAKWVGQLQYQNPTVEVDRNFADNAVQQAVLDERNVEHKKRGRPTMIEQVQQPLMATSKAFWEAEEVRRKAAEARDAVEKERELRPLRKRKGR